ncbi:MAG: hypothetical protein AAF489_04405 [Bacteroidota bacterium]
MAKKKQTTKTKKESKNCFVIMPFGGYFDQYYSEIYVKAIEEAGFESRRGDDLYRPGSIVKDIWSLTKDADVILADLTSKNPNVMYELGLAHAITKPVVLISDTLDDVPFDLRSLRVVTYDTKLPNWGELLKNDILMSLSEILESPEESIPPAFLEVSKTKTLEVDEIGKQILELKNEVNSLKLLSRKGNGLSQSSSKIYVDRDGAITRRFTIDTENKPYKRMTDVI